MIKSEKQEQPEAAAKQYETPKEPDKIIMVQEERNLHVSKISTNVAETARQTTEKEMYVSHYFLLSVYVTQRQTVVLHEMLKQPMS